MTVTTPDPKLALIVVDLQKGIAFFPTVHPIDAVIKHVGALTEAFRGHGLPVVLVNAASGAPGRTEQPQHRHTHSVTQVFPRIGETGTAEDVIELLERSA